MESRPQKIYSISWVYKQMKAFPGGIQVWLIKCLKGAPRERQV